MGNLLVQTSLKIYSDSGFKEQALGQNPILQLKKVYVMLHMHYFPVRTGGCLTERMP